MISHHAIQNIQRIHFLQYIQLHGNLKKEQLKNKAPAKLPYFSMSESGEKGMLNRQCTTQYKVEPITKYIRQEILGLKPKQRAPKEHVLDLWYGISYDEMQRMKVPFQIPWRRNVYPLIEKQMRRGECLDWMEKNKYPKPPRSACLCCPFHSEEEWLKIKNGDAEEWEEVIKFDKAIRKLGKRYKQSFKSDLFLHRTCEPIEEVDFFTLENAGQMSLLDECEGYCGV